MSYEEFMRGVNKKRRRWKGRQRFSPRRECEMALSCKVWLAISADKFWPAHLQDLGDEVPYGLWGKGNPENLKVLTEKYAQCISVVGSRDASIYGTDATSYLVSELAQKGYTIISGGAYGIDVAAHRAALSAGTSALPTVALMAGGLDHFYPVQNSDILTRISQEGLILSEVSIGNTPTRWRFLERNRLIAALSHDIVVTEARWRSGALNTARHGLEIGREIWAVPGNISSPNSVGCHRLIRDGYARILSEVQDIYDSTKGFDALQEEHYEQEHQQNTVLDTMSQAQGRLWDLMSPRVYRSADELAGQAGLGLRDTMVELSKLAQQGLAETDGFGWRKIRQSA